jgi:bifunctional non-homologous end joining protein LigD
MNTEPSTPKQKGKSIMLTETTTDRITLYFKEGSSDKVYQAAIEPSGAGFVVTFAYGRRGSTMQTGAKTASPVDYPEAKKIYDKLIREKSAKGYTPGENGTPYQHTDKAERSTGILPQLLNAIDEDEAQRLLVDSGWWAQEKLDGKRVLIRRKEDEITGINRQGLIIALPEPIVAQALTIGSQHWIMDGEAIGDVLVVFDLLESACVNLHAQPYSRRMKLLALIVKDGGAGPIRSIETATTAKAKAAMYRRLKEQKREGIVFKHHNAAYTPGRPASGGDQLKLKFTATASCIVAGANGSRRSVKLELSDGSRRIGIGNVTISPNHPIPAVNQIVEVRYLYAYPGGSVYQPVYLGKRDDVDPAACTIKQLKFKSSNGVDDG